MALSTSAQSRREECSSGPEFELSGVLIKASILFVIALCGAVAYRFTPLKEWIQPAGEVAGWIRQTGWVGVLAFTLGSACLVVVGVPRLLFCPVAGALYGFWAGLAVSIASTMTSYYAAFLFIRGRRRGQGAPVVLHPRLAFLSRAPGVPSVILSRVVPLPGMLVTLGLSLSGVSHKVYLVGSLVGLIPEAAPLVLLGAGVLQPRATNYTHLAIFTLLAIIGVWILMRLMAKRFKHGKPTEPTE